MTTKTSNKGVVVVPRKEYEALLKKQRPIPVAELSVAERRELNRIRKDMARGDYVTLDELENELGGSRQRKR